MNPVSDCKSFIISVSCGVKIVDNIPSALVIDRNAKGVSYH